MAVYWVNYDLSRPDQHYTQLIDYLKSSSSGWARPAKSSFFVKTEVTAAQLLEGALPFIDDNDAIAVVKVDGEFWATSGLPEAVVAWMRQWIRP